MDENKTYYFTFGGTHPLRDNWIEVSAPMGEAARHAFERAFGARWASQYEAADFEPEHFPGGRVRRVLEVI